MKLHRSIFDLNKRYGFTKFVIVVPSIAIKVYAKLPGWFTVPTPLGSYNPDWAVLVE